MPEDYAARNFSTLLGLIEDGRLHAELTEEYQGLVGHIEEQAVALNAKSKGKISLTLTLEAEGELVRVTGDYKVDHPKKPRSRSVFWTTEKGFLSKANPHQRVMFEDVNKAAAKSDDG